MPPHLMIGGDVGHLVFEEEPQLLPVPLAPLAAVQTATPGRALRRLRHLRIIGRERLFFKMATAKRLHKHCESCDLSRMKTRELVYLAQRDGCLPVPPQVGRVNVLEDGREGPAGPVGPRAVIAARSYNIAPYEGKDFTLLYPVPSGLPCQQGVVAQGIGSDTLPRFFSSA